MSEGGYRRQTSANSDDRSYYSDSGSYYSDESPRNNGKSEKSAAKGRRAFVFMGNRKDLNALKRGTKKQTTTADLINENKLKIGELRNKNLELLDVVAKYEFENRDLRRMTKRQEVFLKKVQYQEDSMPNLIDRQTNETKSLNEQLRLAKERLRNQERKQKSTEEELDASQRKVKNLKSLVEDRGLKKRHDLKQMLDDSNRELDRKGETIRSLERHVENLNKNHKHELGLKKARQQASNGEVEGLRVEVERLHNQLQEKEKESAVFNIYSQQRTRPPHRLSSSIRSTPALERISLTHEEGPRKKASFDGLQNKRSKPFEDRAKRSDQVPKENDRKVYGRNNYDNNTDKDMEEIEKKNQELEELERKIQQINKEQLNTFPTKNNNFIDNNNANNNNFNTRSHVSANKKPRNSINKQPNDKQKEALLEKMKRIDDGKFQASSTNHNGYNNHNKSSIFADAQVGGDYKPSFLNDDDDGDKKAFIVPKKSKHAKELFSDDDDDFLKGSTDNNHSKSPVFLNLNNNNNKHLLPKRPKQQDTSLATLNGIDSDEEVREIREMVKVWK